MEHAIQWKPYREIWSTNSLKHNTCIFEHLSFQQHTLFELEDIKYNITFCAALWIEWLDAYCFGFEHLSVCPHVCPPNFKLAWSGNSLICTRRSSRWVCLLLSKITKTYTFNLHQRGPPCETLAQWSQLARGGSWGWGERSVLKTHLDLLCEKDYRN